MIIGISGRMGSGKDTVGTIIQKLLYTNKDQSSEIKKFAGKLKQIGSLLTGIPVEKFEDQEFKKTVLGTEWSIKRGLNILAGPKGKEAKYDEMYSPMTAREFLQKLGTEAMRDGLHTNAWVNALFADYKMSYVQHPDIEYVEHKAYPNWIITDMRFPNELEAVEEREGITIRVTRPVKKNKNTPRLHPSETALDNAKFDYEIINDGTMEELVKKVKEILVKEKLI